MKDSESTDKCLGPTLGRCANRPYGRWNRLSYLIPYCGAAFDFGRNGFPDGGPCQGQ